MKVSEAFLVNTKNFESIIDTLVKHETKEPVINSTLLEDLCFSDPNDLLVVRILKDFKIINNDGKPSKFYDEFKNANTTKVALAKGLITAYEGLFDAYPKIHQAPIEKIKAAFVEIFQGKKTELIIKYISGTFQKVVSYVGVPTIDKVLKEFDTEKTVLEPSVVKAESKPSTTNGQHIVAEVDEPTPESNKVNDNIDELLQDFGIEEAQDNDSEESDVDVTVQEFLIEDDSADKNEDQPEDDPFGLKENHEEAEPQEIKQENTPNIDVNPVDLDIPLSTATQITNTMEQLTSEHEFVQKALLRKSDLLQKMNRWEDLIPTLEEIIKRYDNEEHLGLQDVVSHSVIRRATALLKLNKTEEALPALNTVIARFKDSDKKEFYNQASRAMLYKANIVEKKGGDGLLPLYNAIIDRLDSSSEILMKEKLDGIHLKRFDLITREGEPSEILDACTKLVERFNESNEHVEYLQKAMIIRAEMLDEMGQDEEALAAYDQFLSAFGH